MPSSQHFQWFYLFLIRYMFQSFDHPQDGIHNMENPIQTTDPLLSTQFIRIMVSAMSNLSEYMNVLHHVCISKNIRHVSYRLYGCVYSL
jgi:hypothetical protein